MKMMDELSTYNCEEEDSSKILKSKLNRMLGEYNDSIKYMIDQRTKFMDSMMIEFSEFNVGDSCINILTGESVKVERIFRHGRGTILDNSFNQVHALFSNDDNTSKYKVHPYCKADDVKNKSDGYINKLEKLLKN